MSTHRNLRRLAVESLDIRSCPSSIGMGDLYVPPNTETEVEVLVRSDPEDELVRGLNLRAQLGDGRGPEAEPVFTGVRYSDTIWTDRETDVIDQGENGVVPGEPNFLQSTIYLVSPKEVGLMAKGTIAWVSIDTRGFDSGSFEVRFADTPFPDTDFAQRPARAETGSITIASPGDSNLDGVFNSTDLISVLISGEYEDDIPLNSNWTEGDWDGSGDFNTRDFVFALEAGKYVP